MYHVQQTTQFTFIYIYKIHVVNVLNKYKNNTCNKN